MMIGNGCQILSREHPMTDLHNISITIPTTFSPSKLSDLTLSSPVNERDYSLTLPNNLPNSITLPSNSTLASPLQIEINRDQLSPPKSDADITEEILIGGRSILNKKPAEGESITNSRQKELGVDINAMIEDLLNDPTPALSPSSPISMQADTSLSSLCTPTLIRQIQETHKEIAEPIFSPPIVTFAPPNQLNMPGIVQPMEANREDAGIYDMDDNNNNTSPTPIINNDSEAENTNELNFNQFWLNQLTYADSWDNVEATLHNFMVAASEKAKRQTNEDNNNNNRPRPQPRPNNVPPRAINRRPQNFIDAREASRIQRLYQMARKRTFHHITKENDVKYDGGKGRAEAFFNDIHSGKNIDIDKLKIFYNNMPPKQTITMSLTTLSPAKKSLIDSTKWLTPQLAQIS